MSQRKKILFICMENSIHSAKWINQLDETKLYDLFIFPVGVEIPHESFSKNVHILEHPFIKILNSLISKCGRSKFRLIRYPTIVLVSKLRTIANSLNFELSRSQVKIPIVNSPKRLNQIIQNIQPDLIHALEFQHSGYLLNAARKQTEGHTFNCKVAISNWGSDIKFFKDRYRDVELISELLLKADVLFVECDRDAEYAKQLFGFSGRIFKTINSVGIDFNNHPGISKMIDSSDRRIIVVKGYESTFGRAGLAYEALENCADELNKKQYKILSYSVTPEAKNLINVINNRGLIHIDLIPRLNNYDLLDIFSKAQIYIGISKSDGISISCIEAMAYGAIPVQTDTSCCNEWFSNELGGFIVPLSTEEIKRAIMRIISNEFDVKNASFINYNKVLKDASYQINSKKVQNFYFKILDESLSFNNYPRL